MDNAVTIRPVGLGDKALQSFEDARVHRLRKGGQQHMGSEKAEGLVFLMNEAGVFAYELPKCFNISKLFDIVQLILERLL